MEDELTMRPLLHPNLNCNHMSWIYKGTVCNIYVAINCVYPSNYGNHANPTDIHSLVRWR